MVHTAKSKFPVVDNFRLNCTPHDVTVLDRGYAQYRVTNLSLDDGFLAVSNMLYDTSSNNMERIVYRNHNNAIETLDRKSVVDGIFYFLEEDEIIRWVVANLTCQQAMQSATYACVSQNSHCHTAIAILSHEGKHFMGISASVTMASKEIHTC